MTDRATANLPSRAFGATAAFDARLGFAAACRAEDRMIRARGPLEIAFFPHPGPEPAASRFSACVRVAHLDALHRDRAAAGLPDAGIPRLTAIAPLAPGLRMVAVVDADGGLLRCLGP